MQEKRARKIMPDAIEIGIELYKYLKDNKIKRKDFYATLGVNYTTMYRYFIAERPIPTVTRIAIYFLTNKKVKTGFKESK